MCLLASEESLSCAANTTFGPQKTADILNYPQRQRATQKRNNAYLDLLEEKKDPRSTPFVIARSRSAASVIACIYEAFQFGLGANNEELESKTS